MKRFDVRTTPIADVMRFLARPANAERALSAQVAAILDCVRRTGDRALAKYSRQFDGHAPTSLLLSRAQLRAAANRTPRAVKRALQHAARNIETFHRASWSGTSRRVTVESGVTVWRAFRAVDRAGLYIPGGSASYPSTVLMCGIPARVAGCREIVAVTPPAPDGLAPAVALACEMLELDACYQVGGAQAIAALAYGTKTIAAVHTIVGPGNAWVAEAKRQVYGVVNIDLPAGPSEIMVVADAAAQPAWIAADLLSQLEHDPLAQAVCVCLHAKLLDAVAAQLTAQMRTLPRRAIIGQSLRTSTLIRATSRTSALEMINAYAPEHLELMVTSPERWVPHIRHAGSIFLGPYATEPLGDYATGANHTLPTNRAARAFGPLGVDMFGKWMQVQHVTRAGFARLARTVTCLAQSEGFAAHARAVTIRR